MTQNKEKILIGLLVLAFLSYFSVSAEESTQRHHFEAEGFVVTVHYPQRVKAGDNVTITVDLETERTLRFSLDINVFYGSWAGWTRLLDSQILNPEGKVSRNTVVTIPRDAPPAYMLMWVTVFFYKEGSDFTMVEGNAYYASASVIFVGPYIEKGSVPVTFSVVDRQNRPLSGVRLSVEPRVDVVNVGMWGGNMFTLELKADRVYDIILEWTSPFGTTARAALRETPEGLRAKGSISLPVDDVSIRVVDLEGRPVVGATVKLAGLDVGSTDSQGVVIVGQVPLDNDYTISVSKEGTEIGSDRVRFTAARTSATVQAGIYDISIYVRDAAGRPVQGAQVELIRAGIIIDRSVTDVSGAAVFKKLMGADYEARAVYEHFTSKASIPKGTRSSTIILDVSKPAEKVITTLTVTTLITQRETTTITQKEEVRTAGETTLFTGLIIGAVLGLAVALIAVRASRR